MNLEGFRRRTDPFVVMLAPGAGPKKVDKIAELRLDSLPGDKFLGLE